MIIELKKHFDNLELPESASQWLLDVWDALQGLDDWYDNDEVSKEAKQKVIYKVLVLLPASPFYQQFQSSLAPVMSNLVLKWCAANSMEESGEANEVSYVWRAGYYDLILTVTTIVHGFEITSNVASYIAKMYGETFKDYLEEFSNA